MIESLSCLLSQKHTSEPSIFQLFLFSKIILTSSARVLEIGSLPPIKDGTFGSLLLLGVTIREFFSNFKNSSILPEKMNVSPFERD